MKQSLELTEEQQKAATCDLNTPLILLAGPGSGKTRTLLGRLIFLIEEKNVNINNILFLTFSKKAQEEMEKRVRKEKIGSEFIQIRTFHSFALYVLKNLAKLNYLTDVSQYLDENFEILAGGREHNDIVREALQISQADGKELVQMFQLSENSISMLSSMQGFNEQVDEFNKEIYEIRNSIMAAKTMLNYEKVIPQHLVQMIRIYDDLLHKKNYIDFTDLIYLVVKIWTKFNTSLTIYQKQIQFILVDEFQDVNCQQFEILRLLTSGINKPTVTIVGDDDQAIYGWRGAQQHIFKEFKNLFPNAKEVKLSKNFRSTNEIVEVFQTIIRENTERFDKDIVSVSGAGQKVQILKCKDAISEAEFIIDEIKNLVQNKGFKYSEIAVLYRIRKVKETLEEYFKLSKMKIKSSLKTNNKNVKLIINYLGFMINPGNDELFKKIYNEPKRGIGIKTFQEIQKLANQESLCLLKATRLYSNLNNNQNVKDFILLCMQLGKGVKEQK